MKMELTRKLERSSRRDESITADTPIVLQTGKSACRSMRAAGKVGDAAGWLGWNTAFSYSYNWAKKKSFPYPSWGCFCYSFLCLFCFTNSYSFDHYLKLNRSWLNTGLYLAYKVESTSHWDSNWVCCTGLWDLMLELPERSCSLLLGLASIWVTLCIQSMQKSLLKNF